MSFRDRGSCLNREDNLCELFFVSDFRSIHRGGGGVTKIEFVKARGTASNSIVPLMLAYHLTLTLN